MSAADEPGAPRRTTRLGVLSLELADQGVGLVIHFTKLVLEPTAGAITARDASTYLNVSSKYVPQIERETEQQG